MFHFEQKQYLQRLGISENIANDHAGLVKLTRQHLRTVPFENFDVLLGDKIDISPEAIWKKVVEKKRGGYCFEVNALFLSALTSFGFEARSLLARVHLSGTPSARTHQVNLVTLADEEWLVDVGFGSFCLRAPLRFQPDMSQEQDGDIYRIITDQEFGYVLQSLKDGNWVTLYSFTLDQVLPADLEMGNYYTSTNPNSHFTKEGIAAIQTDKGRITLRNYNLRIVTDEQEQIIQLPKGKEYLSALQKHFGIIISNDFSALKLPDSDYA